MAFVLVLVLSITTLVSVESGASQIAIARLKAQQNALLGVYVAVGELQRTTGPDQRVTARADVFDTNPDTIATEGVVNPYYVSVFKSVQPGSETQPLEALRAWSTDMTAANRISWLVSSRTNLEEAGVNPATTDAVTLNGGDASNVVTLVRYEDETGLLADVQAGKLDIESQDGAAFGRFAWWVSDENAKFRINATKDDEVLDGQAFDSRWAVMAPHRSNPSGVPKLSSIDVTDSEQKAKLERTNSVGSFGLFDASWSDSDGSLSPAKNMSEWIAFNSSSFTFSSQSIPVDVTQGRLKEDLTVYLETDFSGLQDSDFIVRGAVSDVNYNGRLGQGSFSVDYDEFDLPRFGKIKSWYETGMQIDGFSGGTASSPRRHESDQHGLHPKILRSAVYFGMSFTVQGTDVFPVFLVYPKFTLWNPHNVPIAPAKYVIQIKARTALNTQYQGNWAARNISNSFNYKGLNSMGAIRPAGTTHFNWANPNNPKGLFYEDDTGDGDGNDNGDNPYLTFTIDNDGFAPGETLVYTAQLFDPGDISQNEYVSNQGIDYLASNSSSSDFPSHNLLINADTAEDGFFYIIGNSGITPDPATTGTPTTGQGDTLRARFFVSDASAGLGTPVEPSLTTKVYYIDGSGQPELVEFLDFKGENPGTGTPIDWDSALSNYSPEFDYYSLSQIADLTQPADYKWGFGYFALPMGNDNTNLYRNFVRHNYLASEVSVDDPSVNNNNFGRLYGDSFSERGWFDTSYPSVTPQSAGFGNVDGYDTLGGYGLFHHHTEFEHGTVYPIYDYVRSNTGLLSLGYLANVGFSTSAYHPSFPFGNSEAHTHIDRERVFQSRAGFNGSINYADISYLANESMWDRFFVSTIPQDGVPLTAQTVLPNTRHRLVADSDGNFPAASAISNSQIAFSQAAANVRVEGGFNVNSTSVTAWAMLLNSLLGESVEAADGSQSNLAEYTPSSRRAFPLFAEYLDPASNLPVPKPDSQENWLALRTLSVAEVDELAEAIVAEVKRRGPFLSLADFVNRRLVPDASSANDDYLGLKGTIQTAIDRLSTRATNPIINDEYYLNSTYSNAQLSIDTGNVVANEYDLEHERGMPGNLSGTRMYGAPGYLTQADVLTSLAPLLTVRGDTFTIRSYGESLSPITGEPNSGIWCEVVVQRVASPVDDLDPGGIVAPQSPYGRKFKIVSMRWIDGNEI